MQPDRLANEYARATEIQLATLEELHSKRGSTQSSKRRHFSIAESMLCVCWQIRDRIDWHITYSGHSRTYPRLQRIMGTTMMAVGLDPKLFEEGGPDHMRIALERLLEEP